MTQPRLRCSQEWVSPWERPGPWGPRGVTQVHPCVLKARALRTQLFLLRAFAGCSRGPGEAWAGRPVGAYAAALPPRLHTIDSALQGHYTRAMSCRTSDCPTNTFYSVATEPNEPPIVWRTWPWSRTKSPQHPSGGRLGPRSAALMPLSSFTCPSWGMPSS